MTLRHATACALIEADYAGGRTYGPWHRGAVLELDGFSASQWLCGDFNVCACTGTNDRWDWLRNLLFIPAWSTIGVKPGAGDSGALYHYGFITTARLIYAWADGRGFTHLTGHSLGAAAGGIVGGSLGIPTLTYSAPRVLWPWQEQPEGAKHVVNRTMPGDPINRVVPGYDYYGACVEIEPTTGVWGFRHGIRHSATAKGVR